MESMRERGKDALAMPRCLAEATATGKMERSRAGGCVRTGQRWPCARGVRYVTTEVLWIEVRAEDTNLGSLENRCPLKP